MFMDDSVKSLSAKMARGELAATDVVARCFQRIDQHNPSVNALVTLDQAGALCAAQQADALVGSGAALRPLHAVAITARSANTASHQQFWLMSVLWPISMARSA
jgi:amidase